MAKAAAALVIAGLLACSGCLGAADDASAPTPSPAPEPDATSLTQQWSLFVRSAEHADLPRATWPSTAKNASLTAAIMCHNPASHGATEVHLYRGSRRWPQIRRGDILFARAFCPDAVASLTRALNGRPESGPTTTIPAVDGGR